ncbi:MAG: TcpQ domain-containing protein [Rhodospirillales bacterium]|nr:TcpQ domain-containing protein [Rhodospirillales bacterium]MCB9995463.1 TcpQ domain-containing protein [Rhodospirillales bacterium]
MTPVRILFLGLFFAMVALGGLYPLQARAGFETKDVELFVPTSAWLVGLATLVPMNDTGKGMPCVMANQFSNNFVIRFSGGRKRMLAMAIDFRQDTLQVGKTYDVDVEISPDYMTRLEAVALNNGTALINLQESGGFYDALKGGKYMYMTFADQPYNFALLGASDGIKRMEQCYDPGTAQPTQAQQTQSTPQPQAAPYVPHGFGEAIPPSYREKNAIPDDTPASEAMMPGPLTQMPGEEIQQLEQQVSALDDMLSQAEQKLASIAPAAGTPEPEAAEQPQPKQKQTVAPIGKPLAQAWMAPSTVNRRGLKQPDVMVPSQKAQPAAAQLASVQSQAASMERRWRAIRGSNLREVLDVWSASAHVRLVWQADREYSVLESFSIEGSFEKVVASLLEQYNAEDVRPLARIYADPDNGQKVLVVETY